MNKSDEPIRKSDGIYRFTFLYQIFKLSTSRVK
jgi:hypothetical protein